MKKFVDNLLVGFGFLLGLLWQLLKILFVMAGHFIYTAIICLAFSIALDFSFGFEISWLKLTVFWYGLYLFVNHLKQNMTKQKS